MTEYLTEIRTYTQFLHTFMRGLSEHANARSYWTPVRGNRSRLLPPLKREVIAAYKKDF